MPGGTLCFVMPDLKVEGVTETKSFFAYVSSNFVQKYARQGQLWQKRYFSHHNFEKKLAAEHL